MKIPLSRPLIGDAEREAVDTVLRSGYLASGPRVEEFEEAFTRTVGCEHAIAVNSGTMALQIGLMAAGVGPGDEVIVPSFSFAATANVVRLAGAEPVFVDVSPSTFCLTAEDCANAMSERTVAIMPVHLYGHPAPLHEIAPLAARNGIAVFEDAAQAHGALIGGRSIGSESHFSAFSFYPTKNMTTGEGGMITTNSDELAHQARLIRNQGMAVRYHHEVVGLNGRMTEIAAAIGLIQLQRLPAWVEGRRRNASIYDKMLDPRLRPPPVPAYGTHAYHQYTIRPPNRTVTTSNLEEASIGYGIYYPVPIHLQEPYREKGVKLPMTEKLAEEVVSIPVRPDLDEADIDLIVRVVNQSIP